MGLENAQEVVETGRLEFEFCTPTYSRLLSLQETRLAKGKSWQWEDETPSAAVARFAAMPAADAPPLTIRSCAPKRSGPPRLGTMRSSPISC